MLSFKQFLVESSPEDSYVYKVHKRGPNKHYVSRNGVHVTIAKSPEEAQKAITKDKAERTKFMNQRNKFYGIETGKKAEK